MRLGISVPSVKRLGRQLQRLIFEERLTLSIRYVSADREDEPEEARCHDIPDWVLKKQVNDSTREAEACSPKESGKADVLEQRCNERGSVHKRPAQGG